MKYFKNNSGHTMIELIVVLAIIGIITAGSVGIGIGVIERNQHKAFEEECEMVLKEIEATRNAAVMANNSADSKEAKNTIEIKENEMIIKEQVLKSNQDKNYSINTRKIHFNTFTISDIHNPILTFSTYNTMGGSQTLTINGPKGIKRKLIIQIAAGRIYYTDE